jgi:hypothetical protein
MENDHLDPNDLEEFGEGEEDAFIENLEGEEEILLDDSLDAPHSDDDEMDETASQTGGEGAVNDQPIQDDSAQFFQHTGECSLFWVSDDEDRILFFLETFAKLRQRE